MDPQMSVERSLDAWEEVQRHGQDLADRLALGFSGLLHSQFGPAAFTWPSPQKKGPLDPVFPPPTAGGGDGVAAILDIGNRLGQAGAELGACLNGVAEQFFRQLPPPFFRQDEKSASLGRIGLGDLESRRKDEAFVRRGGGKEEFGAIGEEFGGRGFLEATAVMGGLDELEDEEGFGLDVRASGHFGRPQGSINITSTYDSRTNGIESSLFARGDLWRAEATHGGSTSRNENSPLFLVQLGPVLFVRDATLLLPVHLSKQHLLWYGYDRKNGMHSLCPAIWSKHRRWLLMSMICLNPFTCSYMDLQFPNGQLTYLAGDGLTASAFLPVFGGLLQAEGQYPGDARFSFSCKNKMGTRITPMVQWPDKSISLDIVQALVWKRSGLMLRPTIQFSVCPTFGGSDPGLRAEFIHSVREKLCLTCGCSCTTHPSAFASVSLGRSKWNGNVGSCGIVLRAETPLNNPGRPAVSVQLNSGVEF